MINLIINADDFGYSFGICKAITECASDGKISSTSMMVCEDSYLKIANKYFHKLKVPCGVHLQLNDGTPCSKEMRRFIRTEKFPQDIEYPTDLVRIEWRCQIERFIDHFGSPSHLDSHLWQHCRSQYIEIYIELAKEFGLPVRGNDIDVYRKISAHNVSVSKKVLNFGHYLFKSDISDAIYKTLLNTEDDENYFIEILCHPGYNSSYLRGISTLNTRRELELNALRRYDIFDLIKNSSMRISNYQQLAV